MTKIDKDSEEPLNLDLLIITPSTRKAWDERIVIEWKGDKVKVVSPQGLILLKALRGIGQNQDDVGPLSAGQAGDDDGGRDGEDNEEGGIVRPPQGKHP